MRKSIHNKGPPKVHKQDGMGAETIPSVQHQDHLLTRLLPLLQCSFDFNPNIVAWPQFLVRVGTEWQASQLAAGKAGVFVRGTITKKVRAMKRTMGLVCDAMISTGSIRRRVER